VGHLPKGCPVSLAELPELGASPDAVIVHRVRVPSEMASIPELQHAEGWGQAELMCLLQQHVVTRALDTENKRVDNRGQDKDGRQLARGGADEFCGQPVVGIRLEWKQGEGDERGRELWAYVAEAVEVKSSCPFVLQVGGGKGRQGSGRWAVSCRGPRDSVPPAYIPQVRDTGANASAHIHRLTVSDSHTNTNTQARTHSLSLTRSLSLSDSHIGSTMHIYAAVCSPQLHPPLSTC
jgi:hypothetical protein